VHRLFHACVEIGWRRFQRAQARAAWHPSLLLWPLLDRLVGRRFMQRLGGRLRVAVSGGAALPLGVARMFVGLGLPILQGYGLTETSPVVSVNRLEDNDPAGVGSPLPGIELRFGRDDELLVRGPGVMLGYWNNPEATAQVIDADGWLHTGDQARLDGAHLYITGRIKDILVLSNGEKVAPAAMESAITLDPLFEQAMIVGEGRPYITAIVVLSQDGWQDVARSRGWEPGERAHLRNDELHRWMVAYLARQLRELPAYAKVRRVILSLDPWTIDNGLLTPTLKIKRHTLLTRYAREIEDSYAHGPAASMVA
jgi:long-chain acyl-CoA synthetase